MISRCSLLAVGVDYLVVVLLCCLIVFVLSFVTMVALCISVAALGFDLVVLFGMFWGCFGLLVILWGFVLAVLCWVVAWRFPYLCFGF